MEFQHFIMLHLLFGHGEQIVLMEWLIMLIIYFLFFQMNQNFLMAIIRFAHMLAILLQKQSHLNQKKIISRVKLNLKPESRIISLLPGSRIGELKWHTLLMLKTALLLNNYYKDLVFLIPVNNKRNLDFINKCLYSLPVNNLKLIIGHSSDVINCSDFVIVASGTATLETALYKKPMIIIYKSSAISYLLWKSLRLIPYIGLPNIMLKKKCSS